MMIIEKFLYLKYVRKWELDIGIDLIEFDNNAKDVLRLATDMSHSAYKWTSK